MAPRSPREPGEIAWLPFRGKGTTIGSAATLQLGRPTLSHEYPFDPTYGYDLAGLLAVEPPAEPAGFVPFWQDRYARALAVDPAPRLTPSSHTRPGMRVFDVEYQSTDGVTIRGWFLEPDGRPARQALVVGLGYGGLERPDLALPRTDAAYLIPSLRGLGRSVHPPISANPAFHVLHDLHRRDRYVLGGCVEDVWGAVSALEALRPHLAGRLGYVGHSFGGGIGALALAWEPRLSLAHLDVPSFGHHPLRLRLPTTGAAAAVQAFAKRHGDVTDTLAFYDCSVAARHIRQPMHVAAALFDPVVAPPGQFAIYNALPGTKTLFVRTAGHFTFEASAAEDRTLQSDVEGFFSSNEQGVPPLAQPAPGP